MPVNYVLLKKNGNVVYPKTKLSAIDMTLCNGLEISGETFSLSTATPLQVKQGAASRVVTADGLKAAVQTYEDALYIPGEGVAVNSGTFSLVSVTVDEAIDGSVNVKYPIDNKTLNGAINMGRAVDVWADITYNMYDSATTASGVTTLVKSNADATYYYYGWSGSYPKYAAGLKYLIMADTMNSGDAATLMLCTEISANIIRIPDVMAIRNASQGETTYTRMASCFTTTGSVGLIVARGSSTNLNIKIKNFKVFEVTALNDDAIYALATAENPDEVYEKFLIQQDAVCPWVNVIDMGTSPAVTIGAGLAYRLMANDGTAHTLAVDTFPNNAYGRDAFITIFVGDTDYIQVQSPLVLMDALTPNAVNNCIVKFRNGAARIYVSDTDYGYTVTVDSGTASGSLKYGIVSATEDYIVIAGTLDGTPVNFNGAVAANNRTATIVGHGADTTILTGDVSPTKDIKFTKLSLADVNVTGGTMVVPSGVEIMSGSTVSTNGGVIVFSGGSIASDAEVFTSSGSAVIGSAVIDGTLHCSGGVVLTNNAVITGNGNGGTIDLGGNMLAVSRGQTIIASNCSIISGTNALFTPNIGTGTAVISATNCIFSSNTGPGGAAINAYAVAEAYLTSCTFTQNTVQPASENGVVVGRYGGILHMSSCVVSGNTLQADRNAVYAGYNGSWLELKDCTIEGNICLQNNSSGLTSAVLAGSNTFGKLYGPSGNNYCTVTISSGAIIDLTGNSNTTPINPGGGITIGDNVSIIYDNGGSSEAKVANISGGTIYVASIKNDGTLIADTNFHAFDGMSFSNLAMEVVNGTTIRTTGSVAFNNVRFITTVYPSVNSVSIATLSGVIEFVGQAYAANRGNNSYTLSDNTVIKTDRTSAQGFIYAATLIVGTNVSVINGSGTTVSVTAGTYSNAQLWPDGTIHV